MLHKQHQQITTRNIKGDLYRIDAAVFRGCQCDLPKMQHLSAFIPHGGYSSTEKKPDIRNMATTE